jgi:hypothetical protein
MAKYALTFGVNAQGGRAGFKNKDALLSYLIEEHSQYIEEQIVIHFPDGSTMRTEKWG